MKKDIDYVGLALFLVGITIIGFGLLGFFFGCTEFNVPRCPEPTCQVTVEVYGDAGVDGDAGLTLDSDWGDWP